MSGLGDDYRLFEETKEALLKVGEAGVEYPSADTPRDEVADWWKKMGPVFADVMAGWSGSCPDDIASQVEKIGLVCPGGGVPVRVFFKKKDDGDAATSSDNLPVVIYYHGGGFAAWSYADQAYDNYLTRLAALGQCVVVAVDCRLTPDHPWPAPLDDAVKVVQWVHSGGIGLNLPDEHLSIPKGTRVLLAGDSAGANLAFGAALRLKRELGSLDDVVSGLYFICPYADGVVNNAEANGKYPSMSEFDGYFASEGFLVAVCNCACQTPEEKERYFQDPELWPIQASQEDLEGLPPARIVVMELDMIRDTGIALYEKLKKAGNAKGPPSLVRVAGGVHEQQLFTAHSPQLTDESIHDLARYANYRVASP